MNAREPQRRAEMAGLRRRLRKRHFFDRERLEPAPQAFKLGVVDPGAGASGVMQAASIIVVAEQQRPEIRAAALRVAPADHDKLVSAEAFGFSPQPMLARHIRRIGALRNARARTPA